ncbi:hypothetical protein ACSB3K_005245 [Escherichia coli]|nr:hypothetical protein [Escherichia coli]DAL75960.1 MAG TPA: hypothetical protein [Bacteriophage sp.]
MTSINTTNAAISALYDAELTWGGMLITAAILAAAAFVIARWF